MSVTNQNETALENLANAIVLNESGDALRLGLTWAKSPAILIFLRHFACIACRGHAQQVWRRRETYEQAGARVYFIGNGLPQHIPAFRKEMGLDGATILTDPDLAAFDAAGFKRSFLGTFGTQAAFNFFSLRKQGLWQTISEPGQGNRLQLGGVVLMMPDGHLRYKYTSVALGDFPPQSDLQYISGLAIKPFHVESSESSSLLEPDYSRR
jgi:peroxiredoxin